MRPSDDFVMTAAHAVGAAAAETNCATPAPHNRIVPRQEVITIRGAQNGMLVVEAVLTDLHGASYPATFVISDQRPETVRDGLFRATNALAEQLVTGELNQIVRPIADLCATEEPEMPTSLVYADRLNFLLGVVILYRQLPPSTAMLNCAALLAKAGDDDLEAVFGLPLGDEGARRLAALRAKLARQVALRAAVAEECAA